MAASQHTSAAILSVGDELVLGQKLDTNSRWLSDQLISRGIPVGEHVTIPDDLDQHVATLRRLAAAHPLVISTGGLGPTLDDLTRQALTKAMREDLVEDPGALTEIRAVLEKRGRVLTDLQRTQALRPRSATMIGNPVGTAPGMWGTLRLFEDPASASAETCCDVVCLPGPPGEMRPMFERSVVPMLRPPPGRVVLTRVLHCIGIGEADLATRLGGMMDRDRNPVVGTTASGGVVSIRIRFTGPSAENRSPPAALIEAEQRAREAAGPFLFGEDDDAIESVTLGLLRSRNERLVVAESCTGGGLGALFSETPGSSEALVGGWITYSNEMKSAMLGVPTTLIREHGAVSEAVARAMAEGALRAAAQAEGAHHALAVTGVAGPDGGSGAKPVGTVFIARASASIGQGSTDADVRRFLISGDREDVRGRSARLALMMLRFHLRRLDVPRTLWQVQLNGSPFPV